MPDKTATPPIHSRRDVTMWGQLVSSGNLPKLGDYKLHA